MQKTQGWSLVREDPTRRRALEACALQLLKPVLPCREEQLVSPGAAAPGSPHALETVLSNKKAAEKRSLLHS